MTRSPLVCPFPCWLMDSVSERHMFNREHMQWMRGSLSWDGKMRKVRKKRETVSDMPRWRETDRKPMMGDSLSLWLSPGCCCPTESTASSTPVYYYLFRSMDPTCATSTLMNWFSEWEREQKMRRGMGCCSGSQLEAAGESLKTLKWRYPV